MKQFTLIMAFMAITAFVRAQSPVTEALQKEFSATSRVFFFYNNTLRMLNQQEDPAIDALIRDIEKMKLIYIKKEDKKVDYRKLVADYKKDAFEEAMSSRHEGKNFDVFLKGQDKTRGMLVMINDNEMMMVLDIVGSIPLDQITTLYKTLDESADIGSRIRQFTGDDNNDDEDDNEEKDDNR